MLYIVLTGKDPFPTDLGKAYGPFSTARKAHEWARKHVVSKGMAYTVMQLLLP